MSPDTALMRLCSAAQDVRAAARDGAPIDADARYRLMKARRDIEDAVGRETVQTWDRAAERANA